jgi:hypothetical protein
LNPWTFRESSVALNEGGKAAADTRRVHHEYNWSLHSGRDRGIGHLRSRLGYIIQTTRSINEDEISSASSLTYRGSKLRRS